MNSLMLQVDHFNKSEELYNQLVDDDKSDRDRAFIYHPLGTMKYYQGKYQEALRY